MGLDAVEIVLRTEDDFGISISDDEAGSVRTVGDLYQIVLSKLDTSPSCLSSKAFYRTRKAMADILGVSRREIRPKTSLETLLPKSVRRQLWKKIGEKVELKFPTLRFPSWFTAFFQWGAILTATVIVMVLWRIACFLGLLPVYGAILFPFLGLLLWICLTSAAFHLFGSITKFVATELPVATAGDLAHAVLNMNLSAFSGSDATVNNLSQEEVWRKIVHIFCEQLQISPEEVVPSARIVEDLGIE